MELVDFILASPLIQFVILVMKIVSPLVFLFFLGVILFCLKNSTFVRLAFWQNFIELQSQKAYGMGKVEKKWLAITKRLESQNSADWKLAIIEAESLTEEVLARMGFGGASFGERLQKVNREQLPSLDDLTEAHQVRNNIIHDPDYRLDLDPAVRTVNVYERSLRELSVL